MKKLLVYYNFIIITLVVATGFVSANSAADIILAVLFYPIFVYFALQVTPNRQKALILPKQSSPAVKAKIKGKKHKEEVIKLKKVKDDGKKYDVDRRAFLKLVGSAGTAVFIFSVFGIKKAQAAFFGSVPGPGIVGLKDIAGNPIDPAQEHPTDGYRVSRLDDSTVPSYYGFTNKDGEWFIMKEDASGDYTYAVGGSNFTTNWGNRDQAPPTGPTYQEFYDAF